MKKVFFDESSKKVILRIFNKDVDSEGYIVETSTGKRVLAPNGSEVKLSNFAGIRNGSEIFITSDLPSLIRFGNEEIVSDKKHGVA